MKHFDLFSGIGGFALAADRVFGEVEHTFCEIDPFCQEVLKKHWPQATIYGDIRTLTNTTGDRRFGRGQAVEAEEGYSEESQQPRELEGRPQRPHCDIITGGFPCQPFSQAGRRKGTADDRYLWPEMLRVIREFHPRWIIGENVGGLVTWSEGLVLEQVHTDLEGEGYEVQSFIIPAVSVNAPHRRDRVWIVAHRDADCDGRIRRTKEVDTTEARKQAQHNTEGRYSDAQNSVSQRSGRGLESSRQVLGSGRSEAQDERPSWEENWIEVATRLCRVDDGVPKRLDRNPRLKALGNAIVPQVAEEIMRAIKVADN